MITRHGFVVTDKFGTPIGREVGEVSIFDSMDDAQVLQEDLNDGSENAFTVNKSVLFVEAGGADLRLKKLHDYRAELERKLAFWLEESTKNVEAFEKYLADDCANQSKSPVKNKVKQLKQELEFMDNLMARLYIH